MVTMSWTVEGMDLNHQVVVQPGMDGPALDDPILQVVQSMDSMDVDPSPLTIWTSPLPFPRHLLFNPSLSMTLKLVQKQMVWVVTII